MQNIGSARSEIVVTTVEVEVLLEVCITTMEVEAVVLLDEALARILASVRLAVINCIISLSLMRNVASVRSEIVVTAVELGAKGY